MADQPSPAIVNLWHDAAPPPTGERFDVLLAHRNLVVERIVSSAHITPQTWVQPQDEWVMLLQGRASMTVDGRTVELRHGDSLFLPAGMPHRVTATDEGTVWLAVHLHPQVPPVDGAAGAA